MRLSHEEMLRYGRHLIMPEVSTEGQLKLKTARVLLVGVGGLGSPVGLYLAAAGVGRLGLVDFDMVDLTNLQRQIVFGTTDVGTAKTGAARKRLADLNPAIDIDTHSTRLTRENALEILDGYDIAVDGTDNFPARYLLNDACVLLGKPFVYGGVFRFEGHASVFALDGGPCYRCLYPEPPPQGIVPGCAEGGVLGVLPGVIGSIQAVETIKWILGKGESLSGRLLLFDALTMRFRELEIRKSPDCPICGPNRTIHELIDYEGFCGVPRDDSGTLSRVPEITAKELKTRIDAGEDLLLLDVREPHEYEICHLNALLIPLSEVPSRLGEITPTRDVVVYCRSGACSVLAVAFLQRAGFERVWSLRGGILAWSDEVDPSIPKY